MEVFHKFYTRLQPLAEKRIKENDLSVDAAVTVDNIANEMILKATEIYRRDIMKDKHGFNIDLTKYPEFDNKAGDSFKQKFSPCEVCGEVRVTHQCHIIPKSYGGPNKADNYVILCANHHHLFDNYRLARNEWERINWSIKSKEVREYVALVRLPRQEMHWKYATGGKYTIEGCLCGNPDFEISYDQYQPAAPGLPSGLARNLTCKNCGSQYCNTFFSGYEYEWWWEFVLEKARKGELPLPE